MKHEARNEWWSHGFALQLLDTNKSSKPDEALPRSEHFYRQKHRQPCTSELWGSMTSACKERYASSNSGLPCKARSRSSPSLCLAFYSSNPRIWTRSTIDNSSFWCQNLYLSDRYLIHQDGRYSLDLEDCHLLIHSHQIYQIFERKLA